MKRLICISIAIIALFCILIQAHADGCGKIEIPSINCEFDLSFFNSHANAHQHIAQLYKQQGCIIVGNHYASASPAGGFWKLENLTVGDKAYLEYDTTDGLKVVHHGGTYTCYAIFLADVSDHAFWHKGKEIRPYEETDLICTTCVWSDSTRNYVAFFERVD